MQHAIVRFYYAYPLGKYAVKSLHQSYFVTHMPTHTWIQCFLSKGRHQNHQKSFLKTQKSEVCTRRFWFSSSWMSPSLYLLENHPGCIWCPPIYYTGWAILCSSNKNPAEISMAPYYRSLFLTHATQKV